MRRTCLTFASCFLLHLLLFSSSLILSYLKCFGAIELYKFAVYGPKIAIAADLYLSDTERNYAVKCAHCSSFLLHLPLATLRIDFCLGIVVSVVIVTLANVEFLLFGSSIINIQICTKSWQTQHDFST